VGFDRRILNRKEIGKYMDESYSGTEPAQSPTPETRAHAKAFWEKRSTDPDRSWPLWFEFDAALRKGWVYRGFTRPVVFAWHDWTAWSPIDARTEAGSLVRNRDGSYFWPRQEVLPLFHEQEADRIAAKRLEWAEVGRRVLSGPEKKWTEAQEKRFKEATIDTLIELGELLDKSAILAKGNPK